MVDSPGGESIDTTVREELGTGTFEKGEEDTSKLKLDLSDDPKSLPLARKWIAVFVFQFIFLWRIVQQESSFQSCHLFGCPVRGVHLVNCELL